jgi:hypothetical protein
MGSGQSPATTHQVNKVELPAWVNEASQENYNLAKDIAGRPLEQYSGQTVAGPSGMTTTGYDLIRSNVGATSPLYDKAAGVLDKSTGLLDKSAGLTDRATGLYDKAASTLDTTSPLYNKATGVFDAARGVQGEAADIFRSTAGPLDINQFLNPYTGEVEQRAIANAELAQKKGMLNISDSARKSGAFGGSRHGVAEGVATGEGTRAIGDLSAQLRKAGLDFATSTAIADRSGRQAAGSGLLGVGTGLTNTGMGHLATAGGIRDTAAGYGSAGAGMLGAAGAAGNAAAGLRDTATGYGNVATGRQAAGQQDITNLLAGGQSEQAQGQREIDALMKQFYEKRDYPLEGLNTRLAALGMSPYGRTETTNKTATSEEKGPDWATLGLGVLKTVPALWAMSDREAKTDIEKVSGGDVPMYAYRYKGDPKTYPKVVGPMAQDIQKKVPSAVKKVGKRKVVDYSNLMEVLS